METGCLLDTEILGGDQTAATSDEVSGILLDASEEVSGSSSCIPTTMDFEFTNTDLEPTSDFSIDNSSMFDISESVIDEKGDCGYLFKDSNIFEDVHVKQSGDVDTLNSVSCINKKTSICNDLGLRLQIIPLNNLQFVSTIQTSEGLHILAIPSGSSLNVLPQIPSLIANSQTDAIAANPSSMGAQGPTPTVTDTTPLLLQKTPQASASAVPKTISSLPKSEEKKIETVTSTPSNAKQSINVFVAQDVLSDKTGFVKKRPVIVSSNYNNNMQSQVFKPKVNLPRKVKINNVKHSIKQKKVFKESKIVIDLRKFAQTRKKQMVSLLNNPKTKRLLHQHSQKLERDHDKGLKTTKLQQKHLCEMQNSRSCLNSTNTSNSLSEDSEQIISKDNKDERQSIENNASNNSILEDSSQEKSTNDKRTKSEIEKSGVNISKHRPISAPSSTKSRKIFTCRTCFARFNREGNYKNHLLVHKNCDLKEPLISVLSEPGYESTKTETAKDKDTLIVGTDEPSPTKESPGVTISSIVSAVNIKCELCSMIFTTEGNLTRHKLTHSQLSKGEARFSCETCKRSFLQRCDLRRHQLTHSGQYPFKCSVCNKGFIRRSDLTVHERFHLKEKNYKCEMCSKSYYQSGDLHRHIRTSHSNRCVFTCSQCDRKYSSQKSLNQHLNKHLRQRN